MYCVPCVLCTVTVCVHHLLVEKTITFQMLNYTVILRLCRLSNEIDQALHTRPGTGVQAYVQVCI